MAFATLSNLAQAEKMMRDTDLNSSRLSALCLLYGYHGLSDATLSKALNGGRPLSTDADENLGKLLGRLRALLSRIQEPAQLSFRSPVLVKRLLDAVLDGTFFLMATEITPNTDGVTPAGEG